MNAFELYQLGRRLMKIGVRAMPDDEFGRLRGSTRAIVSDIFDNPGSSISEVTARVELPQSQVSACVAQLRENDVVETVADPADGRRTLVRPTEAALRRTRSRPPAEIDGALAAAVGDDPARLARARQALATLAELLDGA
ncbi:MarR family transcriptional regulator [Amycolatopsis sp. NPDC021455]|uniref:helix-turn-helix domain-containing protein n=1 Tax=Amycolatopsis sp. NPDC021455 TaxID=3154901 RepID=UPI0033C3BC1E